MFGELLMFFNVLIVLILFFRYYFCYFLIYKTSWFVAALRDRTGPKVRFRVSLGGRVA